MSKQRIGTERLELLPLDPAAAAALPQDRARAAELIGARLAEDWPQPDLVDILPRQAEIGSEDVHYGIWLVIERQTTAVIGDSGFHGPPSSDGTLEIGFSIVPDRRRRGYATEAAQALIAWARRQPGVESVVAGSAMTNQASIRTLERLGFQRTGRTGDEIRWQA